MAPGVRRHPDRSGSFLAPITDPLNEPIRVWHLLTHTSGLTYGFHYTDVTDAIYRRAGFEWGDPPGADLAECCARWAALPLAFQPGTEWNYGVSTDVLGRLVLDAAANKVLRSQGEYAWGGAASTVFGVGPREEIVALFLTQLLPSSTYPIRSQLNQLVQQALID